MTIQNTLASSRAWCLQEVRNRSDFPLCPSGDGQASPEDTMRGNGSIDDHIFAISSWLCILADDRGTKIFTENS